MQRLARTLNVKHPLVNKYLVQRAAFGFTGHAKSEPDSAVYIKEDDLFAKTEEGEKLKREYKKWVEAPMHESMRRLGLLAVSNDPEYMQRTGAEWGLLRLYGAEDAVDGYGDGCGEADAAILDRAGNGLPLTDAQYSEWVKLGTPTYCLAAMTRLSAEGTAVLAPETSL